MKLFDKISDEESSEEVEISARSSSQEDEGRLRQEVETEIADAGSSGDTESSSGLPPRSSGSSSTDSGASSKASSGSDSMLPGMSSDASTGSNSGSSAGRSSDVDMEDIHSQNEKIIGLLKDIKSEVGGTDQLL